VPRFLISWSAIKGNACAMSEFRRLVRRKTSKSCCLQHAPTHRSFFRSTKSRLPTPLMSTRCSGRSVPFWINGRSVCPPAKIRARDPHSERISSTSSIEVGAEYVNIPGLFGHPSKSRRTQSKKQLLEAQLFSKIGEVLLADPSRELSNARRGVRSSQVRHGLWLHNTPQRAVPFHRNPTRTTRGSPLFTTGVYSTT
jgi:hypothetical protein